MGDWLQEHNVADVLPFTEAFRKVAGQYYPDKIDVCKDAVSIFSVSYIHQEVFVTYVEINEKCSSTVVVTVP